MADREGNLVWDAAGPEVFSFTELVAIIREAVGSHALLMHLRPRLALLAARGLGLVVRDTLLTAEELEGLMAGLLVSRELPRGSIRFTDWLAGVGIWLGCDYLPEIARQFRAATPCAASRPVLRAEGTDTGRRAPVGTASSTFDNHGGGFVSSRGNA